MSALSDWVRASTSLASLVQATMGRPSAIPQNTVPAVTLGVARWRHGPGVHSPIRQLSTQPSWLSKMSGKTVRRRPGRTNLPAPSGRCRPGPLTEGHKAFDRSVLITVGPTRGARSARSPSMPSSYLLYRLRGVGLDLRTMLSTFAAARRRAGPLTKCPAEIRCRNSGSG